MIFALFASFHATMYFTAGVQNRLVCTFTIVTFFALSYRKATTTMFFPGRGVCLGGCGLYVGRYNPVRVGILY